MRTPPIGILLEQQLSTASHKPGVSSDAMKRSLPIEQTIFAMTCSANESGLKLYPLEIEALLDAPTAFPDRKSCKMLQFVTKAAKEPPTKRAKTENGNSTTHRSDSPKEPKDEVEILSELLLNLVEPGQEDSN